MQMELNKENIINQIITNNYASTTIEYGDGKIKATLRTLPVGDQLAIEEAMGDLKDKSQLYILHKYSLLILARSLLEYNGKKFNVSTPKETYEFIETLPTVIVDILTKYRENFQTEVLKIITPGELENYFFPVSSSGEGLSSS